MCICVSEIKVIHTNTYTSYIFIFNQICSQFLKLPLLIRYKNWIHFIVQNYVIRVDQTHQSKCVYEWVTNMRIWGNNFVQNQFTHYSQLAPLLQYVSFTALIWSGLLSEKNLIQLYFWKVLIVLTWLKSILSLYLKLSKICHSLFFRKILLSKAIFHTIAT